MQNTLVSVVMPAYNHERYVGEAIESVLNQTYSELELVIIDDGSTDNTAQVIQSFSDSRINYHYQHNQDAFNALNNGMAMAKGDFIAIINSDDVYTTNRLEKILQAQRNTQAHCLFSDVSLIDDQSNVISDENFWWNQWHIGNRQYYYDYQSLYAAFLHANIMVTTSNLVMSRQAYQTVGNFKPLRYLHDYDYIFRLLNAFPGAVTYLDNEKLMSYRLHGSNTLSDAAVIGREQDRSIIRENLLNLCPAEITDLVNIGLDRLISLEHELVAAKAELAQARQAQNQPVQPSIVDRIKNKIKQYL